MPTHCNDGFRRHAGNACARLSQPRRPNRPHLAATHIASMTLTDTKVGRRPPRKGARRISRVFIDHTSQSDVCYANAVALMFVGLSLPTSSLPNAYLRSRRSAHSGVGFEEDIRSTRPTRTASI